MRYCVGVAIYCTATNAFLPPSRVTSFAVFPDCSLHVHYNQERHILMFGIRHAYTSDMLNTACIILALLPLNAGSRVASILCCMLVSSLHVFDPRDSRRERNLLISTHVERHHRARCSNVEEFVQTYDSCVVLAYT